MKYLISVPLRMLFGDDLFSSRKPEPVFVSSASSIPMRPVEIRRNLRHLRESRYYSLTREY
jgi:hypothetical protein